MKCFLTLSLLSGLIAGEIWAQTKNEAITIAWQNEPRTFDPRYAVDANSQYLENLLHCSLVQFGEDGRVLPSVAQSWAWKDSRTLHLKLNPSIKFSDGSVLRGRMSKPPWTSFCLKTSAVRVHELVLLGS